MSATSPVSPTANGNGHAYSGDAVQEPSWKPLFVVGSPPDVKYPYNVDDALDDIAGVQYALEVFLSSHMLESEEFCRTSDETKYVAHPLTCLYLRMALTTDALLGQGTSLFCDWVRAYSMCEVCDVVCGRGACFVSTC